MPKCKFCGKNNIDWKSKRFLVDGVVFAKGCCHACYTKRKHVLFCPKCMDLYKCSPQWGAGLWENNPLNSVPCKKHSLSQVNPIGACGGCGVEASGLKTTSRGHWLCDTCWYGSQPCSASCCSTQLHKGMSHVISTPGGAKLYCKDCALVRTMPKVYPPSFHPLSWDYQKGCMCLCCVALAGRSSLWPVAKAFPTPDVECSVCKTDVHSSTAVTPEGDTLVYCHMCQADLITCKLCKAKRSHHQFHTTPFPHSHSKHGACDYCLKKTNLWLCKVNCHRWYKPHQQCPCGGIFSYDYTPQPHMMQFLSTKPQGKVNADRVPYLGLEIEIEAQVGKATRAAGAQLVNEIADGMGYVVHDGSLLGSKNNGLGGDLGFEFVTWPFTYDWFEENWHRFEDMLNALRKGGYRAWEGRRCGIHVHVSRQPMTEAHQMKFINFVYGSTNMMLCIGQRGYRDPAVSKHSPFHGEDRAHFIDKVRANSNPGVSGHYCALNANKPATLEARWFRGTLNPKGVRKNVEFMHSLWWFTKAYGHTSANEINYMEWLREPQQVPKYRVLREFLERQYITRR